MGVIILEGRRLGVEETRKQSPVGQTRWAHTTIVPGRVGPTCLGLGVPFVRFVCPQVLFLTNIDARKFAGDLDDVRVPER